MRSWARIVPTLFLLLTPAWAALSGCNQADNPAPVTAPPPPAPKAEETAVPKKAGGQPYGSNDRYQRAMERMHNKNAQ